MKAADNMSYEVTQLLTVFLRECVDHKVEILRDSRHPLGRMRVRCGQFELYIHGDWSEERTFIELTKVSRHGQA